MRYKIELKLNKLYKQTLFMIDADKVENKNGAFIFYQSGFVTASFPTEDVDTLFLDEQLPFGENLLTTFFSSWENINQIGLELIPAIINVMGRQQEFTNIGKLIIHSICYNSLITRIKGDKIVCLNCFGSFSENVNQFNLADKERYFGCAKCLQNKRGVSVNKIVAIIDRDMMQSYKMQDGDIIVNYLKTRDFFVPDTVVIKTASDEEAEKLLVSLGNNGIRHIPIDTKCALSINTMRIIDKMQAK